MTKEQDPDTDSGSGGNETNQAPDGQSTDPAKTVMAGAGDQRTVVSNTGDRTVVANAGDQHTVVANAGDHTVMAGAPGQRSVDIGPTRGKDERFDLGELLGEGGLATVHMARDASLRRLVALKYLKSDDHSAEEMFLEEAQITAQLQHPNIVPVYDLGQDADGRQFLAMKPVEGDDLSILIARAHKSTDGKGAGEKLRGMLAVFCRVCDAVAYAHDCGVIHRDLKPGNIMVGAYGEVLVMDWGLAKPIGFTARKVDKDGVPFNRSSGVTSDRRLGGAETMAGAVQGTPAYMAPEQAIGGSSLDQGCDLYALGGILYTMLTGRQPAEGDTVQDQLSQVIEESLEPPSQRAPMANIPHELEAIVLKAMAWRRVDRYEDVASLKAEVEAYLDNRYVTAARYTQLQKLQKWVRRHPTAGVAVAMSVLVVAIASLGLSLYLDSERRAQMAALAQSQAERQAAEEREQAADARVQAAEALTQAESAREQTVVAREQTAEALEQTAAARELAAAKETERLAAEQRERDERLRRQTQEEKLSELKRDLVVETEAKREAAIEEFMAAWTGMQKQGYTQERFSASLNRNDVDRYKGAFERRFRAFRLGAVELEVDDYFYYGVLLQLALRQYQEAIGQYDSVLKLAPDHQAALSNRGLAYYEIGNYEAALQDQSSLIDRWPAQPTHWFNRGASYLRAGRHQDAIADFRQVLALDDRNAKAWLNLAGSLAGNGNSQEALEAVQRALKLDPSMAESHNTLGTIQLGLKHNKEALAAFSQAIQLDPDVATFYSNRGRVYGMTGDFASGLKDLNRAMELGEKGDRPRIDRAIALFNLGDYEKSLVDLDAVLAVKADNTYALSIRAAVRSRMGDLTGGLADLNAYLEQVPNDAMALSNRCATHHQLGNLQQAFDDANRAVQLRPDDPRMLSNRGDMHRVLGRYEAARQDLKRAVQIRPEYFRAWQYLGQTELATDNQRDAFEAFASAIRFAAERNAGVYFARGEAYEQVNNPTAAAEDYLAAIRVNPDHWESWHRIGLLRLAQDNRAAARQSLEKAHALCDDLDARGKIASALRELGVEVQ